MKLPEPLPVSLSEALPLATTMPVGTTGPIALLTAPALPTRGRLSPRAGRGRRLLWLLTGLAAAAAATGPAWAGCPPQCVTASSVVNAAGVPDGLASAAGRLQFRGPGLAAGSNPAVQALAAEIRRLPAGASVTLRVATDAGLTGSAATSQANTRQRALQQALQAAGVKPGQVKLDSGP